MNRLLAEAAGVLNGFLAIVLIVVGAVFGYAALPNNPGVGVVVGLIVGFIVASIACGVVALVVEMRGELIRIREALNRAAGQPEAVSPPPRDRKSVV